MSDDRPLTLRDLAAIPVERLRGVGPRTGAALGEVGIRTVLDLLQWYPRRWVDRTNEARVRDLGGQVGQETLVLGRVDQVSSRPLGGRGRGRTLVTARVSDASGSFRVTFFNQAWRERQLSPGTTAAFFGKVELFQGRPQMTNPVVDLIGDRTGRIVAVYPQSERAGVHTWDVAGLVAEALRRSERRGLADPLPPDVRRSLGLVERGWAVRAVHLPESMRDVAAARTRLVFDELLRVQVALVARKVRAEQDLVGLDQTDPAGLVDRFLTRLPFPLTDAQRRALSEIWDDLRAPLPMHRLLQGEVGSGKTVVAAASLLAAVGSGRQGAFMAPTEVLAEQHAAVLAPLIEGLTVSDDEELLGERPVKLKLLTSRTPAADRRTILDELKRRKVDLVVGTHALIQDAVTFHSLGAVVIDEQHRFGVEQRAVLREGARHDEAVPDVLVMTATPIPRTAALTVYGDLDSSVLDELPPGRTPVSTRWARGEASEPQAWEQVRAEVDAGRQAYVVCPLIEESEKLEAASATAVHDRLAADELRGLRVGLVHGRVLPRDKELTMAAFRSARLDVLVATTVIEVGVDVPNATVMVILDADRFGLAQLHQLRGRVGRGAEVSTCWLVTGQDVTEEAESRLRALVAITDGFELAERDLELRGEGHVLGDRQKGRSGFRLASLRRDRDWVERARGTAQELVGSDPALPHHPLLADEIELLLPSEEQDYLFRS